MFTHWTRLLSFNDFFSIYLITQKKDVKKIADAVSQIKKEKSMKWDKGEGIKWHEGERERARRWERSKTDALDLCIHKVDIHVAILNDFFLPRNVFLSFHIGLHNANANNALHLETLAHLSLEICTKKSSFWVV